MSFIKIIRLNTVGYDENGKKYLYENKFYKDWRWYLLMPLSLSLLIYMVTIYYGGKNNIEVFTFFIVPLVAYIYLFKKVAVIKEKEIVEENKDNIRIIFLFTTLIPFSVFMLSMFLIVVIT